MKASIVVVLALLIAGCKPAVYRCSEAALGLIERDRAVMGGEYYAGYYRVRYCDLVTPNTKPVE